MKSKLICLVLCLACFLTMLASCGADCEAHVDADKNSECDNCGIPVYTVIEKVPTEEQVVEMIVSAIPSNATLGTVYPVELDDAAALGTFVKNEDLTEDDVVGLFPDFGDPYLFFCKYTEQTKGAETTVETNPDDYLEDDEFVDTYALYSLYAGKNIVEYKTDAYTLNDEYNDHVDSIEIDMVDGFFIHISGDNWVEDDPTPEDDSDFSYWYIDTVDIWYLANGQKIADSTAVTPEDKSYVAPSKAYTEDDAYAYIVIDDTIYVYDIETCALLTSSPVDVFVDRPEFDYCTATHGYVDANGTIYVYDLSKWIECVYSYEIPVNGEAWILANGKILAQKEVVLPKETKNYDYTDGVAKYDIVYTVVDPIAKTETKTEFGYYILDVSVPEEGEYAAAVKNLLVVNCIKDKNLDKVLTLACDDALSILADVDAVLPAFVTNVEQIADGVYLGVVNYGEGSSVRKLYDAKGAELATLPNNASIHDSYIECNGKFYDFTMKLILDVEAFEGVVDYRGDTFLLINKTTEQGTDTYYWNAALDTPVLVAKCTNAVAGEERPEPVIFQSIAGVDNECFVVRTETIGATETTYTYDVYNAANVKVLTSDEPVEIEMGETEKGIFWAAVGETTGTLYFAK